MFSAPSTVRSLEQDVVRLGSRDDPEEFVDALRKVVLERAVENTLAIIEKPPGRRPRTELLQANAWFATLSEEDRATLRAVASMVARDAVFGVLAVLDGARVVEDTSEKGDFRLTFSKGGRQWLLNPPDGPALHDLLPW